MKRVSSCRKRHGEISEIHPRSLLVADLARYRGPMISHATKLALFTTLMVAGSSSACSDSSSSPPDAAQRLDASSLPDAPEPPDAGVANGNVMIGWNTLTADAEQTSVPTACPDEATTAVIFLLLEGEGTPLEDFTACADGARLAADVPPGRYTVWIRLTDDSRTTRFAESVSQIVDVVAGQNTTVPTYDIFVDRAFYVVSWTLIAGAESANCDQISGGGNIAIDASDDGATLFDVEVPCASGMSGGQAASAPLPIGEAYAISISLLNREGLSIGTAQAIPAVTAGTLEYGNELKRLGPVEIILE